MFNLASVPEHIREWFERDLLPELERLRTIAETAAQKGLADAQRALKVAQAVAAVGGPEASALVAAAEQGVTEAQDFLAKVLGGKGLTA